MADRPRSAGEAFLEKETDRMVKLLSRYDSEIETAAHENAHAPREKAEARWQLMKTAELEGRIQDLENADR